MGESPDTRQRLFFALWPAAETRETIAKQMRDLPRRSGRPVPAENLHLTLAFIGSVDAVTRQCLERQAAQVRVVPFDLTFSECGYFSRARVLWVAPEQTPTALIELVRELNEALLPCGYQPERRPFRAHMTLFRKAFPAADAVDWTPIRWPVENFALVRSITSSRGAQYEVLRHFGGPHRVV